MSYKASRTSAKKRLFQNQGSVTPADKRVGMAAIQKAQLVKFSDASAPKRSQLKKKEAPLTKRELIEKHTELLEDLQNSRLQLEDAQKENQRLKKELMKVKLQFGEAVDDDRDNADYSYYSND